MRTRVTIGDFSRASHLSVKTLRHYHEVGLLEPSEIDPDNGYRYYSEDQIPAAQVIRRLRGLQMPVSTVKFVLAAPDSDTRNRLIVEHLNQLEHELAQTRSAVEELRDLLERPEAAEPIEHRTVPPTPAVGIQQTVDRDDIFAWWQGALGELNATIHAQRLHANGTSGGVYSSELFEHGRGDATVFIPAGGSVTPVGRVVPLVIPAAELAVARHHGSPADIDLTYGRLGAYAMKHAISVDGPVREYYLVGLLDTDDQNKWDTEIGWPIFNSDPQPDQPATTNTANHRTSTLTRSATRARASLAPRQRVDRPRAEEVASAPFSAHSETVRAGAKMPVRKQRQVSTKAVTRAGYYCSTPEAVTAARLLLPGDCASVDLGLRPVGAPALH